MSARTGMKTIGVLLASAVIALPAIGRASKADAFEDKIEPVSGQLYQKARRFELTLPTLNLSLNDAFFHKYFGGLKATYHFSEAFSAGANFATGFVQTTGSTSLCTVDSGCQAATDAQLYQVPGYIKMMGGAEVAFSPIYGKLNILADGVLHFDVSIIAGGDYIAYRDVVDSASASNGTPATKSTIGGHVGLGVRAFLSNSVAIRVELKDYLYSVHLGNQGKNGIQNQLFVDFGLSFFFPLGYKAAP